MFKNHISICIYQSLSINMTNYLSLQTTSYYKINFILEYNILVQALSRIWLMIFLVMMFQKSPYMEDRRRVLYILAREESINLKCFP